MVGKLVACVTTASAQQLACYQLLGHPGGRCIFTVRRHASSQTTSRLLPFGFGGVCNTLMHEHTPAMHLAAYTLSFCRRCCACFCCAVQMSQHVLNYLRHSPGFLQHAAAAVTDAGAAEQQQQGSIPSSQQQLWATLLQEHAAGDTCTVVTVVDQAALAAAGLAADFSDTQGSCHSTATGDLDCFSQRCATCTPHAATSNSTGSGSLPDDLHTQQLLLQQLGCNMVLVAPDAQLSAGSSLGTTQHLSSTLLDSLNSSSSSSTHRCVALRVCEISMRTLTVLRVVSRLQTLVCSALL